MDLETKLFIAPFIRLFWWSCPSYLLSTICYSPHMFWMVSLLPSFSRSPLQYESAKTDFFHLIGKHLESSLCNSVLATICNFCKVFLFVCLFCFCLMFLSFVLFVCLFLFFVLFYFVLFHFLFLTFYFLCLFIYFFYCCCFLSLP